MAYYTYPPSTSSASGVPTYPSLANFPSAATAGNGALAIALDTDTLYISNGTVWEPIASPGTVLGVGTFDSGTPSPNGAHVDSNLLIMQSASASNPGEVNTGTQTFAGNKTFNGKISAANLSGQNSGDSSVVFRPGGTQSGVVYNNWADLYAAISALDIALVDIAFDNSIQSITIPAGTYDLTNTRFEAPLGRSLTNPIVITLANGCVFTGFPAVTNLITLQSASSSAIFTQTNNSYLIGLQFAGVLSSSTGAPMIIVPTGMTLYLILFADSSIFGASGFPLIELQGTATLALLMAESSTFSNDSLSGGASSSFQVVVENPNVQLGSSQSAFTGTTTISYPAQATNMTFGANLGDLVYADATGKGTVLAADVTNTKKFLSEQSVAGSSRAPVWSTISSTDLPAFTGDVTTIAGSTVTTVAAIQGKTVSGTTGTGSVVFSTSPTLVTPTLGAASATSLSVSGQITSTLATGTAPFIIASTTRVANLNVALAANIDATSNATLTTLSALTTAASLATVGTITTGTWNATTIAVNHGGTGLTSGTSGGILGFTGTTTLASSALLTANQLIVGGGAGATPATLAAGTSGQYLRMNATPIPAWFTIPAPTVQIFTNPIYSFTITSASATAGSTYTNNSQTFQLIRSITSATTALLISITGGAPAASGTLTSAETGVSNLTFSAQTLSSGATSGTYTPTAGTVWFKVRMVGGGGGGAGGGTAGTAGNGGNGGNTTLTGNTGSTVLTCGGASGGLTNNGNSQFGGLATIVSASGTALVGGSASPNVQGFSGNMGGAGNGASSPFGGRGGGAFSSSIGTSAIGSTGSGGGGGGAAASTGQWGAGGAAGGYVEAIVSSVVASYAYVIGAGGAAGTAGTSGAAGGIGGSGYIEITEYPV